MSTGERQIATFSWAMLAFRFAWNGLVFGAYFFEKPWKAIFFLCPFAAVSFIRGVMLLRVPHRIVLDRGGARFAWGHIPFLLPWVSRRDLYVPWSELLGVRTHTIRVNSSSSTTLIVDTASDSFEIEEGIFDLTMTAVQTQILDYIELLRRPDAVVAGADVDSLRTALFTPPLRLNTGDGDQLFFGLLVLLGVGVPSFVWLTVGFADVTIIFTLIGVGLCTMVWFFAQSSANRRVLMLSPAGFVVGPSISSPLRRWDEVRSVRKTVTNGVTSSFSVLFADGTHRAIFGKYGPHLDTLAALFDPEGRELTSARQLLASGLPVAEALSGSGLASNLDACRRFEVAIAAPHD